MGGHRMLEDQTSAQQFSESGFSAVAINNLRDIKRESTRVRRQEQEVAKFLATPGPMGPTGFLGAVGLPGHDGAVGWPGQMGHIGTDGLQGPEGREVCLNISLRTAS